MTPNINISKNNKTVTDDTEFSIGDRLTITIDKTEADGESTIEIFDQMRNRRFYSRSPHEHIFSAMIPHTAVLGKWEIEIRVKSIIGDDISQQFPLTFAASSDAVPEQISEEPDLPVEEREEIILPDEEIVEISENDEITSDRSDSDVSQEGEDPSEPEKTDEEGIEEILQTEPNKLHGDQVVEVNLPALKPEEEMTVEPTEVAFEEVIREETPLEEDEEDLQPEQPKEVIFEEYIHEGDTENPKLEPVEIEYETIPDLHEQDDNGDEILDEGPEADTSEIIESEIEETDVSTFDTKTGDFQVSDETDGIEDIVDDSEEQQEDLVAEETGEELTTEEPEVEEPVIVSLNELSFEEQQAALDVIETPDQLEFIEPVVLTETQRNDLEIPLAELDEIETKYYNNLKASNILYISHLLENKPTDILAVSEADVVDVIIWLQRVLFILSNPEHGLRSEYRKIRAEYLEYQRQLETLMESKLAQDPLSALISVNKSSIRRLNDEGITTVGQLLQHQLIDLMNLDIDPEKPLLPKLWIANAKSYLAIK